MSESLSSEMTRALGARDASNVHSHKMDQQT